MKVKSLSRVRLLATPWTAALQAPPSVGFSRQEYWSWGAVLLLRLTNHSERSEHSLGFLEMISSFKGQLSSGTVVQV